MKAIGHYLYKMSNYYHNENSMRPVKRHEAGKALQKLGPFRLKDALKAGLSQATLMRMVAGEEILKVGRGLYLHPDSHLDPTVRDFAVACAKMGKKAAIGGMTALFHYGLIEQVPNQIWVLVPFYKKTTDPFYRCIRTRSPCTVGVEDHGAYKITTLDRSIVEAFRYQTKLGLRTAVQAAKRALKGGLTTEAKIFKVAKEMKYQNHLHRYWEAVIAPA